MKIKLACAVNGTTLIAKLINCGALTSQQIKNLYNAGAIRLPCWMRKLSNWGFSTTTDSH